MKPLSYLKKLIKNGHYWQYTDVRNKGRKPKLFFLPMQWIIILLSVVMSVCVLNNGFSDEFVGYTNAVLAILTGLYLAVVISIFDKFDREEFTKNGLTERQKNNLKLKKNFFIQFTSLTTYSIIIALFCLGLLSLSLLFKSFNTLITIDILIKKWQEAYYICFIKMFAITLYRVILMYFLINIIYISSYIISSVYSYIVGEYDSAKIDNN